MATNQKELVIETVKSLSKVTLVLQSLQKYENGEFQKVQKKSRHNATVSCSIKDDSLRGFEGFQKIV